MFHFLYSFFRQDDTDVIAYLLMNNDSAKAQEKIKAHQFDPSIDFKRSYRFNGQQYPLYKYIYYHDKNCFYEMLHTLSFKHLARSDKLFFEEVITGKNCQKYLKNTVRYFAKYYVDRECYDLSQQIILNDSITDNFAQVPTIEVWRLLCGYTSENLKNDWIYCEKSMPGFLVSMSEALFFMNERINDSLTLNVITELLDKLWASKEPKYRTPNAKTAVEKIIIKYHQMQFREQDNEEKLMNIIQLISNLIRLQPFLAGNTRLFSILIFNRELIKNGFSPCIMNAIWWTKANPFDLFDEVVKGMILFQNLKNPINEHLCLPTNIPVPLLEAFKKSCRILHPLNPGYKLPQWIEDLSSSCFNFGM